MLFIYINQKSKSSLDQLSPYLILLDVRAMEFVNESDIGFEREFCSKYKVEDEEAKINQICKTFDYSFSCKTIKFYMKLASVKLENCKRNKSCLLSSSNNSYLRENFPNKLTSFVILLIFVYFWARGCMIAYVQFEHDTLLSRWNPQFKVNATKTEHCVLKNDIYFKETNSKVRLDELNERLEALGSPLINVPGVITAIFCTIGIVPVIYYIVGVMFVYSYDARVDVLNIIFNHRAERKRIRAELIIIIKKIIESAKKDYKLNCSRGYYDHKPGYIVSRRDRFGSIDRDYKSDFQKQAISHLSVPLKENLINYVRPANLTSVSFKRLLKLDQYFLIAAIAVGLLPNTLIALSINCIELYFRVNHRRTQLECLKWHPDGVPINDYVRLNPLDPRGIQAYQNYDGSISYFIYLATIIEINLTPSNAIISVGFYLSATGFILLSTFYYDLYLRAYYDKIVWINQLKEQIEYCIKALKIHKLLSCTIGANESRERSVDRALIITYLNYELFRRQQRSYELLSNFLLLQLSVLTSSALLISYIITIYVSPGTNRMFFAVTIYMFFFTNSQLIISAYKTSKIEKLMKCIDRLLAAGSLNSMENSAIIRLWNRQLLSEQATREFFAGKLFGIYLNYGRIVTFNVYFSALWVMLLEGR